MKIIDTDHPFYRPLWRRVLLVAVCAIWTGVEFYNNEQTWGTIFLVVTAYVFANLILFFKPSDPAPKPPEEADESKG